MTDWRQKKNCPRERRKRWKTPTHLVNKAMQ